MSCKIPCDGYIMTGIWLSASANNYTEKGYGIRITGVLHISEIHPSSAKKYISTRNPHFLPGTRNYVIPTKVLGHCGGGG